MAKKRIAKKGLHYLMSDLFTATVIAAADKKADMEKVATTQEKILKVYGDFNSRLSNYERTRKESLQALLSLVRDDRNRVKLLRSNVTIDPYYRHF